MRETWRTIEDWLAKHAPHLLLRLRPGASEADLAEAEVAVHSTLPPELTEHFRIHDGEDEDEAWLLGSHSLLPLSAVVHTGAMRASCSRVAPTARSALWMRCRRNSLRCSGSSKWIPFAYDGSGGYLHVDVSPGAAGTIGQVIQTTSDGEYRYVAPSLRAFFETFVLHLEAGAFEVFDGGLEPRAGDNHWWEHEARGGAA